MTVIEQAELKRLFEYDPETGMFTRRVARSSNARAGSVAGTVGVKGYLWIQINGKKLLAHRLAWLYVHGCWPTHTIDHVNRVKADNRIANLRDVPLLVNMQNTGPALGYTRDHGKWAAQIRVNRKHIYLGAFHSKEAAHARYLEAKAVYHPEAPNV